MDEDLSRFCCQNNACPDHGKRGIGNLTVCARYGKHKHIRLLDCRTCRSRFSERKGTPLFGSQLSQDKAVSLLQHLANCNGVRATARLVESPPTPWSATAASRATTPEPSTTSSWRFPPQTQEIQFDEMWSFVFQKQTHCDPEDLADANRGDWWDPLAYDPEHRLVLCVVPGARDVECVEEVVHEAKRRTGGRLLSLMTSDAYPAYETALLDAYEALLDAYEQQVTTTPQGRASRRMVPEKVPHRG